MPPEKPSERDKDLVRVDFLPLYLFWLAPKTGFTTKDAGNMNFYTEEAPGLKVTPKTVLITSLIYLGIVVVLHLVGKMRAENPAAADAAK